MNFVKELGCPQPGCGAVRICSDDFILKRHACHSVGDSMHQSRHGQHITTRYCVMLSLALDHGRIRFQTSFDELTCYAVAIWHY